MKDKKMPFFIKLKKAIFNFDEYNVFSEEKTWTGIKYIIKLILIFVLGITIALTCKFIKTGNKLISEFNNDYPNFSFNENILQIESENKRIVKGDNQNYIGVIVDSTKDNLQDIEESNDYTILIAILKDRIVYKDSNGEEKLFATYNQIGQKYELENIKKETISEFLSEGNLVKIYIVLALVYFMAFLVTYMLEFFIDILILSIVGYLLNMIIKSKLKYKSIFNISIYALTLSIILYMIYIILNIFTGFTINYFEIAYNAIAYIYVITALFMIKSDLIKQQIEVGKIVKEQKRVREEHKEKQEKEEDKKEQKPKKDNKEKNKDGPEGETPEGTEA